MSASEISSPAELSGWDRRRNLLFSEYERVALELFAAHGFRNVTVDDIAEAAGVSARTLFRYFPTKEDFLLGFPRRGVTAVVDLVSTFEPSADPFETAWQELLAFVSATTPDVEHLTLWRRAAADAPEVVDRIRGERVQALLDALTDYFARSFDVEPSLDVRPRLLAGIIAGSELALIESLSRSELRAEEIYSEVRRHAISVVKRPKKKPLASRSRRR